MMPSRSNKQHHQPNKTPAQSEACSDHARRVPCILTERTVLFRHLYCRGKSQSLATTSKLQCKTKRQPSQKQSQQCCAIRSWISIWSHSRLVNSMNVAVLWDLGSAATFLSSSIEKEHNGNVTNKTIALNGPFGCISSLVGLVHGTISTAAVNG